MKKMTLKDIEFSKFFAILFSFLIVMKIFSYMDGRSYTQVKHDVKVLDEPTDISEDFLIDNDGKKTSVTSEKGRMKILAFWAPWCRICASEFPDMDKASLTLAQNGFDIIPITKPGEDKVEIATFLAIHKITNLKNYIANDTLIGAKLGVRGYPMFFLVNDKGMAIASLRPEWGEDDLLEALKSLGNAEAINN